MTFETTQLDATELAIKAGVERVARTHRAVRRPLKWWTAVVKKAIAQLGKRRQYYVCASGCEGADSGE